MPKFRKKPVVIEAELFDLDKKHRLSPEFRAAICDCNAANNEPSLVGRWHIHTLEGPHRLTDLDYIIKGVKGEFYACKPDIFKMTYEPVE